MACLASRLMKSWQRVKPRRCAAANYEVPAHICSVADTSDCCFLIRACRHISRWYNAWLCSALLQCKILSECMRACQEKAHKSCGSHMLLAACCERTRATARLLETGLTQVLLVTREKGGKKVAESGWQRRLCDSVFHALRRHCSSYA